MKFKQKLSLWWWKTKRTTRGWYYKTFHPHSKSRYFSEERLLKNETKYHTSPSGKYLLVVQHYTTNKDATNHTSWGYSRGIVGYTNKDGQLFPPWNSCLLADVKLNYGHFPFCWVEGHLNGHDYLLCTEDYQGLTVIELDTGKRKDYLPKEAYYGVGFCHTSFYPSPDKKLLAAIGCVWAAPYECLFYDFSEPLRLPYREVYQDKDWNPEFFGWLNNNECEVGRTDDRRKDGRKREEYLDEKGQLSQEKSDEYYKEEDWEEVEIKTVLKIRNEKDNKNETSNS